jgi:hypothetical protein
MPFFKSLWNWVHIQIPPLQVKRGNSGGVHGNRLAVPVSTGQSITN